MHLNFSKFPRSLILPSEETLDVFQELQKSVFNLKRKIKFFKKEVKERKVKTTFKKEKWSKSFMKVINSFNSFPTSIFHQDSNKTSSCSPFNNHALGTSSDQEKLFIERRNNFLHLHSSRFPSSRKVFWFKPSSNFNLSLNVFQTSFNPLPSFDFKSHISSFATSHTPEGGCQLWWWWMRCLDCNNQRCNSNRMP